MIKMEIKKQLKRFLDSFKLDSSFIKIILFDLLFYAIVLPLGYLLTFLMKRSKAQMDQSL